MKTENLAIVFTDIVGFTEATSRLTRVEHEAILENHNALLLPLVKRFKGWHVKSIGDCLLLTFRSPTDAMLCCMAMQDALHEYNQTVKQENKIHIRIAASLGEVRVKKNDIFGEPVNVTSRIEGITPPDEIYLSEAIHLAMSKAEVPVEYVGERELKGIKGAIRIYSIPRFATTRLVAETVVSPAEAAPVQYPFGGAHLSGGEDESSTYQAFAAPMRSAGSSLWSALDKIKAIIRSVPARWAVGAISTVFLLGILVSFYDFSDGTGEAAVDGQLKGTTKSTGFDGSDSTAQPEIVDLSSINSQLRTLLQSPTENASPFIVAALGGDIPEAGFRESPDRPRKPGIRRFSEAKQAYRARKISKTTYNNVVRQLKIERKNQIIELKNAYNAGQMSKSTYKQRYRVLVEGYE